MSSRRVAAVVACALLLAGCTSAKASDDPTTAAGPARYAAAARVAAKEAGVNPQLLMAILYNEDYKPHDAASQRLWQALDTTPSLGVANMHQATYEEVRVGHDFAAREFDELVDDPQLALRAAAWYLRDRKRRLPSRNACSCTRDELVALGYNTGPGNMRLFAKGHSIGPTARRYLDDLRANWDRAAAALRSDGALATA